MPTAVQCGKAECRHGLPVFYLATGTTTSSLRTSLALSLEMQQRQNHGGPQHNGGGGGGLAPRNGGAPAPVARPQQHQQNNRGGGGAPPPPPRAPPQIAAPLSAVAPGGDEPGKKKRRRNRNKKGGGGGGAAVVDEAEAAIGDGADDEEDEADSELPGSKRSPGGVLLRGAVSFPAGGAAGGAAVGTQGSGIHTAFLSTKRWNDADIALSPPTMRALTESFKFEFLSKVQAATRPLLLRGEDVFAKAKTGGGKTLGFLIPALERLVARGGVGRAGAVGILVVSPTRELALQIWEEAKTLGEFHRGLRIQAIIGGTNMSSEARRMTEGVSGGRVAIDILVATPGRACDHIENTPGFVTALGCVSVLILDEADRLLDMGFEKSISQIERACPRGAPAPTSATALRPAGRQTLLFSATVPEGVKMVAHRLLRQGYPMVDTVGADDSATNPQVTQEALVVRPEDVVHALARTLTHIANTNPAHKTVVFLTTARMTGYMATIFERSALPRRNGSTFKLNVVEMHSRKSQGQRNAAAERFRAGSGMVMFSSDVSARGMDYPGITEVIQVGLTDRESYIHRLGRTARAGREGAGLLILSDFEAGALLPDLSDLPINNAGPASELTGGTAAGLPGLPPQPPFVPPVGGGKRAVGDAFVRRFAVCPPIQPLPAVSAALLGVRNDAELLKEANQAYGAALGFYNGALRKMGWDKPELVAQMNALFLTLGCPEVPIVRVARLSLRVAQRAPPSHALTPPPPPRYSRHRCPRTL